MARLWLVIGKGETVRIGTGLSRQKKKKEVAVAGDAEHKEC